MKIVLAIDSFKGCATSKELSLWMTKAITSVYPEAHIHACEISDGGEGLTEALVSNTQGRMITCNVHDPLMNPICATYGLLGDGKTCVIEMAQAAGLPLVPKEKRNPLVTTTYGVGELVKDALNRGIRSFIIGIGGSATNDAAVGMLQALGFRFLDASNKELGYGGVILEQIHHVDTTQVLPELRECSFKVACDVDNVMYGTHGSAHVYAAQKGADEAMIERLDAGMKSFATVIEAFCHHNVAILPGSGAAGGMGGGLMAFLGATLHSGIDLVLDQLNFNHLIKDATMVITGEGRIDRQSLMGKVICGIAKRTQKADVPLIALAGGIADELEEHPGVDALFSIAQHPLSLEEAMQKERTKLWVERSTQEIFRLMKTMQKRAL